MDLFAKYLQLLRDWSRIHRLTGSAEPQWIVESLILDSLLFLKILAPTVRDVADFGSGAGIPGVPLRIVRPQLRVTLIESRQRRVSFLATAVRELGLEGVSVLGGRLEDVSASLSASQDAVVARCAGGVEAVWRAARGLLRRGGCLVVSGPPRAGPLPEGWRWVAVEGWKPGHTRRFAVSEPA